MVPSHARGGGGGPRSVCASRLDVRRCDAGRHARRSASASGSRSRRVHRRSQVSRVARRRAPLESTAGALQGSCALARIAREKRKTNATRFKSDAARARTQCFTLMNYFVGPTRWQSAVVEHRMTQAGVSPDGVSMTFEVRVLRASERARTRLVPTMNAKNARAGGCSAALCWRAALRRLRRHRRRPRARCRRPRRGVVDAAHGRHGWSARGQGGAHKRNATRVFVDLYVWVVRFFCFFDR